jgi:hypothetical protein
MPHCRRRSSMVSSFVKDGISVLSILPAFFHVNA